MERKSVFSLATARSGPSCWQTEESKTWKPVSGTMRTFVDSEGENRVTQEFAVQKTKSSLPKGLI